MTDPAVADSEVCDEVGRDLIEHVDALMARDRQMVDAIVATAKVVAYGRLSLVGCAVGPQTTSARSRKPNVTARKVSV